MKWTPGLVYKGRCDRKKEIDSQKTIFEMATHQETFTMKDRKIGYQISTIIWTFKIFQRMPELIKKILQNYLLQALDSDATKTGGKYYFFMLAL